MFIGLQDLIILRSITKPFNRESYFKENFQSLCNPINILGPCGRGKNQDLYIYIISNLMPYVLGAKAGLHRTGNSVRLVSA